MKAVPFFLIAVLIGFVGEALKSTSFGNETDANLSGKVTIDDLISYAYRKNPSVVAAREAWKALPGSTGIAPEHNNMACTRPS